jgi:hypothetical protein
MIYLFESCSTKMINVLRKQLQKGLNTYSCGRIAMDNLDGWPKRDHFACKKHNLLLIRDMKPGV